MNLVYSGKTKGIGQIGMASAMASVGFKCYLLVSESFMMNSQPGSLAQMAICMFSNVVVLDSNLGVFFFIHVLLAAIPHALPSTS